MAKALRAWLRFTPFKLGLLVSILAALFYEYYIFPVRVPHKSSVQRVFESLDNRATDIMFNLRPLIPTTGRVAIVDIDDRSLREPEAGGLGQWPWARDQIGKIVENLDAAGAAVVGFDVVFAEPDARSPYRYARYFQKEFKTEPAPERLGELDNDRKLNESIKDRPVVLGYVFNGRGDKVEWKRGMRPWPEVNMHCSVDGFDMSQLALVDEYSVTVNCAALEDFRSEGFFNNFPDESGMVRRVPLFIMYDDGAAELPYPSLAFEVARVGLGIKDATLNLSGRRREVLRCEYGNGRDREPTRYLAAERAALQSVTLGGTEIPVGETGELAVNYRGPSNTFEYVSAADVYHNIPEEMKKFRGKFVLVGATAAGLLDLRATPFSEVYPGVEVHANVIDNILAGDFLREDRRYTRTVALAAILLGGALLSALLVYGGPLAGGMFGMFLLLLLTVGNYYLFFLRDQLVGTTYPFCAVLLVLVAVALHSYFSEGRQKRQIRGAFGLYLSPTLVDRVAANPQALRLEGEQKELSVLFSDIRGFTSISETMSPRVLSQFLNEYLTPMADLVMNTGGGTVDKFIGDAVMAFWGAPLDDPRHAIHAARAALAMQAKLGELLPAWRARGLPAIKIGIGINTGLMSVGNMGSIKRFSYTVMGDNVNLASRLEGLNKEYGTGILISQSTRAALGEAFFCRTVDLARVKGKQEPVRIYELLCEGAPSTELRAAVERFEQALSLYCSMDWDGADSALARLEAESPCLLYSEYRRRIQAYREEPPAEPWDGVYVHTKK